MKKKGQVMIFFIVGIVIILAVGSYFLFSEWVLKSDIDLELDEKLEIPEKIKPIDNYLTDCLEEITEESIEMASMQGGYIDLPIDNMPTSRYAPLGRNVEVLPGWQVPLWFRERGNGILNTEIPTKKQIEEEIQKYIETYFAKKCVVNLKNFFDQGYVLSTNSENLDVKIKIQEGSVVSIVKYPINVEYEDIVFTISQHQKTIPSTLGKLYDVAVQIMESENEGYYFENKTLDMLIASDPEIPFSGVDTVCGGKIWSKQEVIDKIRNMLVMNVGAIKIKDSDYSLQDNKFSFMELDMLEEDYSEVNVNLRFGYSWPLLVEISPSKGDVLESNSFGSQGSTYMKYISQFACLEEHNFVYDLKFPILITLKDESGEFYFATEVIIDNNEPRENRISPSVLLDNYEAPICDYATNNLEVNTHSVNKEGNVVPLGGVDISLKCTPMVCEIGKTSPTGDAKLKAPSCVNAAIVGAKEGYYLAKDYLTLSGDRDFFVDLILKPIYKLKTNVKIIDEGEIRDPYESESVLFNFISDDGYFAYYSYPEQNEIELIPGDYEVESYVFGESTWPISTQKKAIKHCVDSAEAGVLGLVGLSSKTDCYDFEIPSMTIDSALKGGAKFDYKMFNGELAKASQITLYVMADPIPGDLESMADIQNKIDINSEDPDFRYPEL